MPSTPVMIEAVLDQMADDDLFLVRPKDSHSTLGVKKKDALPPPDTTRPEEPKSISNGGGAVACGGAGEISLTPAAGQAVVLAGPAGSPCGESQAVESGDTLALPTTGKNKLVSAAAAANGLLLPPGRFDGEELTVINTGPYSVQLATSARQGRSRGHHARTELPPQGAARVAAADTLIESGSKHTYLWVAAEAAWY